jgi:protein-S-isoprenylcysteine O-methyltransferase Ste14
MKEMTRWGIGPKWALTSILCTAPLMLAVGIWRNAFAIRLVPRGTLLIAGCVLLAVGIPFCVTALVTLHRGFVRGELFTGGVYGLCRHPIYASWIVFIVPGILLLVGSWTFVLVPVVMYAVLRFFVRDEEAWLEATFQEEYRAYRRKVPAVIPARRFWLAADKS